MKIVCALVVALLTLAALISAAYVNFPSVRTYETATIAWVPENRTQTVTKQFTVNGQTQEVKIEVPYVVRRPVAETRTHVAESTKSEVLQFWVIIVLLACVVATFLAALSVTTYMAFSGRKQNVAARELQKHLGTIIALGVGILAGLFGGGAFSEKPPPCPQLNVLWDSLLKNRDPSYVEPSPSGAIPPQGGSELPPPAKSE